MIELILTAITSFWVGCAVGMWSTSRMMESVGSDMFHYGRWIGRQEQIKDFEQ